jgi:hypothetical protein
MREQPAALVEEVLKKYGPGLSSSVAEILMKSTGVSNDYARKLIQRSGPGVLALEGIRFPRNEQFLYLQGQHKTDQFWHSLLKAFEKTGSVYGLAINSLQARDNIIPTSHFGIVSGSPDRLKGHIAHEVVLKRLIQIGLLDTSDSESFGSCVTFAPDTPFDSGELRSLKARVVAEQILLDALRDWARKLGFGSYDRVELRSYSKQPRFGQFDWDLAAPTYVHPFVRFGDRQPKPGFFVADVLLGKELSAADAAYFVNKAKIMRRQRNTRPFMAVLVANYFSREAFKIGKEQGLIFSTPDTLFGNGIAAALKELIQTLTNAAAAAVKNPKIIEDLFSKLGKLEGAAMNLRGPLFEMILAYLLRNDGSIDVGYQVRHPETGEPAEVDVLVKGSGAVRACECKGYGTSRVDLDEVKEWLEKKVPKIRKYFLSQDYFRNQEMSFEFWITGQFTRKAIDYLEAQKRRLTKYRLAWKDGKEVREYVRLAKESYAAKLLDEQYFRHPLSRLDADPPVTKQTGLQMVTA